MTDVSDIYAEQEARVQNLRDKHLPPWAEETLIDASWAEFYRQYPSEVRATLILEPESIDWNRDRAQAARYTRSMDAHRKGVEW